MTDLSQAEKQKAKAAQKPKLEMSFDINILEHLGLHMYTSLPAVVAEYVANSWDAGARKVDIKVPLGTVVGPEYAVSIEDNGCGMTVEDLNKKFLVIGRPKREKDGNTVKVNKKDRTVIGRKGIGKLAGFGVAGKVSLTTRRGGQSVTFSMDYDEMKAKAGAISEAAKVKYEPEISEWGPTTEQDGTTVMLSNLKRVELPDAELMRRHLARKFSVLGAEYDFALSVNDIPIVPVDRDLKPKCEFVWEVPPEAVKEGKPWTVSGWIGTMKDTVDDELNRGVVVMARGKMVQAPTFFEVGGTGFTGLFATAYMVGEIHAEFLDDDSDEISTDRASIMWDGEKGQALQEWGSAKVKKVCSQWADKRSGAKLKSVKARPLYAERIENLPKFEKDLVEGLLKKIAVREDVTEDTVVQVAEFLAEGVEYKGFLALVDAIDKSSPEKPEVLISFIKEWEVLDAIQMSRVVEGRLHAIVKFQQLVGSNAKEVPDIHDFLVDNPWLLDPTWNYIDDEVTLSKEVKEAYPQTDVETARRRVDFLCLGYGRALNAVEIKRPSVKLGIEELNQIHDYVDYLNSHKGTGGRSYDETFGYLIGGERSQERMVAERERDLKKIGIYVYTYKELDSTAQKAHRKFIDVLQRKAERTKDIRVKESYERLRKALAPSA